jgi:hypothetical protein
VVDVIEKDEQEDWAPSPPSVNRRMVLEWMDTDLWLIRPFGKPFSNPQLPAVVTKSILEALDRCVIIPIRFRQNSSADIDLKGIDVNPNNIFLSGLESRTPTVKLGDLDNSMLTTFLTYLTLQSTLCTHP